MAKVFTNPWFPQLNPISQDELGTAFMFFTLQGIDGAGWSPQVGWRCTVLLLLRTAMQKSPGRQFQFQCRGLELGTLPAGRPRVTESFRSSS